MQLKEYKLRDIGRVITGKTPATSNNVNFEGGTIPFYTPEDVAKGFDIKSGNKRFITSLGFEEIKNNTIAGESVLVGCIGSDMGNVAYVNEICATNQQINSITDFKEFVEPLYVYYLLSTMKPIFRQLAGSTTTPILAKSVFENITISLPRLETQKRVCKILSSFDSKIVLNRQINQNLEALARQLYNYWFVQFDFPDANGKPYKSSGGKMVYNPILKREIPEGWHCGNLYEIATFTNGLACQKYRPESNEESLRVIKIREMHEGFSKDTEFVTSNIPETVKVYNGDVLFSWSASLEVMLWAKGAGGLNQHIFKVTSANDFPKSFYYYQLLNYVSLFKQMAEARKTTMGHITQDHLEQSRIAIPDSKEITYQLEGNLAPIFEAIINNESEISSLTKQRDELLPLLMNGQVNFDLSAY